MTEKFDPFYIGKDGEKTCQKMSKILWPIFLHSVFGAIGTQWHNFQCIY